MGKTRLRSSDLLLAIEDCGPSALPIVALVSFLIGLILAFVGAVGLNDWAIGLVKAAIFGAIVAVVGCWRGMRCSRSAAAVGDAATSAVVLCIVLIIVVDAIATVICTTLNL